MKKIISIALVIMMFVAVSACGNTDEGQNEPTILGTSRLSVIIPDGYVNTEDDEEEEQVAYYFKDDQSMDFDVYQWSKEGLPSIEEEAQYLAEMYGSTASPITVNGLACMMYLSIEEYDGVEYYVYNYMFDDGDFFVEICFWTDNSDAELKAVEDIINTITLN